MNISHYRLEEEIGRGGMGVVYRAVDSRLGRAAAIKLLPPDATADPERHRRFVREAQAASALNHPNIVTIYEIGEDAGTTFIAMELVDGTPLDQVLAGGPLPLATALDYGTQIAGALEVAHSGGIIHRDIKPANIIITREGRVKVLDFGLAKLIQRNPTDATITAATVAGTVMGTAAYMSPEQAEGHPVDSRSDIFSFGAVLYEMLAGRRPFGGSSPAGLISAILRDEPPPIRTTRPDAPMGVEAILRRTLAKDPAARYPHADTLHADLAAIHARLTRPPAPAWRRPVVLIPVALLLVAAAGLGVWQTVQSRRARWARQQAIPEIERLLASGQNLAAVRLAGEAERYAPDEVGRVRQAWYPVNYSTTPEGADVAVHDYLAVEGPWLPLGQTPLAGQRLPFGYYRVRVDKSGYAPLEIAGGPANRRVLALPRHDAVPEGMVPVPGGPFSVGVAAEVRLPDFWIDRLEVTNQQFKRFVDANGYADQQYWTIPFADNGRTLPFAEAIARFRDTTGRPGPASWELGTFPAGQADFPVGGLSWFEANAYARFAGKSLPTVYHWYRAAPREEVSSDILQLSNFDGTGPVKAGERRGLGPWGTLDMAGNVKEWCTNIVAGTALRYILGGSWNEPHYRYVEEDGRSPWERRPTFGVRLVKTPEPDGESGRPIARLTGDPKSVVPVSDDLFDVYRRFYSYDRTPLNARVDHTDDTPEYWRMETISFDAAYGGERVPAHLFLPKTGKPPYQTVVLFPSRYAVSAGSSQNLDYLRFSFIVRSGRAVLYPVYQGTYERRKPESDGPTQLRELQVQWAKDFFRGVDYLETRKEIDSDRLAYYSLSMGAYFGPIPVALEPRIKTAVFASGGMRFNYPPEIQTANFMPRVKVPVLLINGRDDFQSPLEAQQRVLELLGTPPEHKLHIALEGGHVPTDARGMIRHVLDWLDKYLGSVK
ncbi:MAG: protein kinase [Acidobacteria bacterium]|nr:protein kinase [Acidobacteriota bacterium]